MTHASRDTSSGLLFEEQAQLQVAGINLSKGKLCKWVRSKGIEPTDYLSWEFKPDEAYFLPLKNEVIIYEKKTQNTAGSCDEKLGACRWKIQEYKDLFQACGINKVSYIYILSDWFKNPRYTKLLRYIRNTPDCDYFFWSEYQAS